MKLDETSRRSLLSLPIWTCYHCQASEDRQTFVNGLVGWNPVLRVVAHRELGDVQRQVPSLG